LEKIEMKKTLVAVAALAAVAGAHAEVTISGVFEVAYQTTSGTNTLIGGTNGNEIGFSVSEDLGGGLKAIGATALLHSITDGNGAGGAGGAAPGKGIGSRTGSTSNTNTYNSYVGLSGEFGTVKLGQQFSNTFLTSTTGDVHGRSGISNYRTGGNTGQIANSLNYTSPAFSGVSVSYQQVLVNDAGYTTAAAVNPFNSWSVNYSAGAFAAGYAASSDNSGATKESVIAASYDFGMAKVHLGSSTYTGQTSGMAYGLAIPMGAATISFGSSSGYKASASAKQSEQMFQVKYDLSKRTNAYWAYSNITTTSTTANIVGIRHNF